MSRRRTPPPRVSPTLFAGLLLARMISQEDLAVALGVTRRTLIGWATNGEGPRIVKLGGQVYYFREDAEVLCAARGKALPKAPVQYEKRGGLFESAPDDENKLILDLFSRAQLASLLNVSERTLKAWATVGEGPRFYKWGGFYTRQDINAWIQSRVRGGEPPEL